MHVSSASPMMVRPRVAAPVLAGGGHAPAPTASPAATPAAPTASAQASAWWQETGKPGLSALTQRAQSFLSNLWDSVIGPMLKGLMGMFQR